SPSLPQSVSRILSLGGGLKSLWKGCEINALRAGLFTGGSLTTYTLAKGLLSPPPLSPPGTGKDALEETALQHAAAGGAMGVVGTLMYMPADAVRGRVYNATPQTGTSARSAWAEMATEGRAIWRRWGWRGMWKGTGAAMMRTVPSCMAFPIVMERTRKEMGMGYYE
ncbi:hypothetical protein TrRE_jg13016, partial [Triparma retinervis]